MARVLRTSKAEEDLLEIWSYVADDSLDAADRLLDDIDQACTLLAEMPQAGRTREELGPNLRSLAMGNYVIFYRPSDNSIVVIRVLHGARDLPGLL